MDLGLCVEETRDTGELRTHVAEITNMPVDDVGTLYFCGSNKGNHRTSHEEKRISILSVISPKATFLFCSIY